MLKRKNLNLPAALAFGAVCQIGQIVFLRELLMVFHGNEISMGIILASWMALTGAGGALGALLAKRLNRPEVLLGLSALALAILLPASVLLIRTLRGLFSVPPGVHLSVPDMALSCLLAAAPVCLLLGVQFVLLARAWRESDGVRDASGAGKTYIGEAAGSAAGGLVFTLLLVHYLNALQAAFLAGLLLLAGTLGLRFRSEKNAAGSGTRRRIFLAVPVVAAVFPLLGLLDGWAHHLQWRLFAPEYRLLETRQSKYGTVSVVRRDDQIGFFQSGHFLFSAAGPETADPPREEQEAALFAHFSMVQHPNPRRLLLIGGGLRGTLREIARHPAERIDYLELDPNLTAAARTHLPEAAREVLESPRVRLVHTDGRLFVRTSSETYDLIIVDVPDPTTAALNRYYTEDFFREAALRLNPGGVFVIGVLSTPALRGRAVANRNAAVYHTLKRVFPRVLPAGERFLFFFAAEAGGPISADAPVLKARYRERNIEAPGFSAGHFDLLLKEEVLRRTGWILRNHGRSPDAHLRAPEGAPLFPGSIAAQEEEEKALPPVQERFFINSDLKPIGYFYTLVLWNALTRADRRDAFGWILGVRPGWIAPAAALLLLPAALRVFGRFRERRTDAFLAVLFAALTTGLSTMALQIALIFSFQSLYGFVYEMIGLIAALFMAGLALGARLTRRFVADPADRDILAGVQFLIAVFAALTALVLPAAAALKSPAAVFLFFSGITLVSGILNGLDFPLTAACCLALKKSPEKAAGLVYGTELFGACAGALLAGVAVAPVLGISACCLLAAAGNAAAFLALVATRR